MHTCGFISYKGVDALQHRDNALVVSLQLQNANKPTKTGKRITHAVVKEEADPSFSPAGLPKEKPDGNKSLSCDGGESREEVEEEVCPEVGEMPEHETNVEEAEGHAEAEGEVEVEMEVEVELQDPCEADAKGEGDSGAEGDTGDAVVAGTGDGDPACGGETEDGRVAADGESAQAAVTATENAEACGGVMDSTVQSTDPEGHAQQTVSGDMEDSTEVQTVRVVQCASQCPPQVRVLHNSCPFAREQSKVPGPEAFRGDVLGGC